MVPLDSKREQYGYWVTQGIANYCSRGGWSLFLIKVHFPIDFTHGAH